MSGGCDACGKPGGGRSVGGAIVCRTCYPALMERLEAARAAGRPVSGAREARAMLRETAQDYILRDVPQDLWDAAKHAAVDRKMSLRELLLQALRNELAR